MADEKMNTPDLSGDDLLETIVNETEGAHMISDDGNLEPVKPSSKEDDDASDDSGSDIEDESSDDTDRDSSDEKPSEPDDDSSDIAPEVVLFNEVMGTEYKTVDDINKEELRKKVSEYDSISEKLSNLSSIQEEMEQIKKENEALRQSVNPKSFFVNDTEYQRQVYLNKYPDYNPDIIGRISKISSEDLDNMNPVDVLKMERLLEDGDIYRNEQEVIEALEDEFDFTSDDDLNELGVVTRNKILKAAKTARKKFKDIMDDKELPDKFKFTSREEKLTKLKEEDGPKWQKFIKDELRDKLKKVSFFKKAKDGKQEVIFEFDVAEDYYNNITKNVDTVIDYILNTGIEFSEEGKTNLVQNLIGIYKQNNMDTIMEAYANQRVTQKDKEVHEEIHNPKDVHKNKKGPKPKTEKQKARERAEKEVESDLI